MLSTAVFVGNESQNMIIIPVSWSENYTFIQVLERYESEGHPTENHIARVMFAPVELGNLIDALVMRYNDLPDKAREGTKIELKRVVDLTNKTAEDIPF